VPVVRLPGGIWRFDKRKRLGRPGGTGTVYEGRGTDGSAVAIKVLHYAVPREKRMAEYLMTHSSWHVLPILDAGYDDRLDRFVIIMPRAGRNLEEVLSTHGPFDDLPAARILLDIALGITELGIIAHRDLKPRNILELEGRFVICDFGISRFLDAATSRNTTRDWMTREYAAPEQWRRERCTQQTDIYALGCLGYELVVGNPPFEGYDDELEYMHLYEPAPAPPVQPKLAWLLTSMLRKAPEDRPRPHDVVNELERLLRSPPEESVGLMRLASVGAESYKAQLIEEANLVSANATLIKRRQEAVALCGLLEGYRTNLLLRLKESVPAAKIERWGNQVTPSGSLYWNERLVAGEAFISIHIESPIVQRGEDEIPITGGRIVLGTYDVLATARVEVGQAKPEAIMQAMLAARTDGDDQIYRWWEHRLVREPRSNSTALRWSLSPKSHPLDNDHFDSFCDRWAIAFSHAIEGNLSELVED
jgi:serine/threonine protein kinase